MKPGDRVRLLLGELGDDVVDVVELLPTRRVIVRFADGPTLTVPVDLVDPVDE